MKFGANEKNPWEIKKREKEEEEKQNDKVSVLSLLLKEELKVCWRNWDCLLCGLDLSVEKKLAC